MFCVALFTGQSKAQQADQAYLVKTFDLDQPEHIDIETSGGFIRVKGSETDEVRVEMYVRRNNRYLTDTDTSLDEFEISIEQDGNSVRASARREGRSGWQGWRNRNLSVSFIVYTPEKTRLDARTSGGSITADNLEGDLYLRTSGGSLTLSRLTGKVDARTSGGSIRIESVQGELDARTSGGSITAENSAGKLNVRTSGGSIRLENISGAVDARTSGGSIRAKMDRVSEHLDLQTSGGSIRVELPKDIGFELDLRGSRVQSELDGFTGTVERNSIRGTIHEGGPVVRARTSGGTVSIRYL